MSVMAVDRHGTYGNYTSGGCRCDECRAAAIEYHRKHRATNEARRQYEKQYNRDRRTAIEELRARHQDEFDAILARIRGTA